MFFLREQEALDSIVTDRAREEFASCEKDILMKSKAKKLSHEEGKGDSEVWEKRSGQKR